MPFSRFGQDLELLRLREAGGKSSDSSQLRLLICQSAGIVAARVGNLFGPSLFQLAQRLKKRQDDGVNGERGLAGHMNP